MLYWYSDGLMNIDKSNNNKKNGSIITTIKSTTVADTTKKTIIRVITIDKTYTTFTTEVIKYLNCKVISVRYTQKYWKKYMKKIEKSVFKCKGNTGPDVIKRYTNRKKSGKDNYNIEIKEDFKIYLIVHKQGTVNRP